MANILDSSQGILKSNSLITTNEADEVTATGKPATASSPHEDKAWSLKNLCYTGTLVAYFIAFVSAIIVASRDVVDSKKRNGKKSTRQAPFHALKFSFRNPIIFCALGIFIAASFDVWAHNLMV